MTIQTKAINQYFPVELFNTLYEMVLTLDSVNEILVCPPELKQYRFMCMERILKYVHPNQKSCRHQDKLFCGTVCLSILGETYLSFTLAVLAKRFNQIEKRIQKTNALTIILLYINSILLSRLTTKALMRADFVEQRSKSTR